MNDAPSNNTKAMTRVTHKPVAERRAVVVRFCGDSGDGMQVAGAQLTYTSALAGNDIATFPDFPAEIRAPRGTLAGVSGFQIQFAADEVLTPGDEVDALVAMNPAALKTNVSWLKPGATVIVDDDAFDDRGLRHAGYDANPLEDGSLEGFDVLRAPVTSLTKEAVAETGLGRKDAERCRNFFALGLVYWLFGRDMQPTLDSIEAKFGEAEGGAVAAGARKALNAGWSYGETTEALERSYIVPAAKLPPGRYRNLTGNEALVLGLIAAARLSNKTVFYAAYPITPASDILHHLARQRAQGVRTFQAEDEIASVTACIGAAFGGAMAVTGSSGPGIALKAEALGLAVMLELPMIVIDVQRGGPSTGLPTKPEQTDLLLAMFGRSGEAPMPVLAPAGPGDCFDTMIEAWRIATRLMTPVMVLSDAFTANGAEPWRVPELSELERIPVTHPETPPEDGPFKPYSRDEMLARPWAVPGTPGLEHRIGGLEKKDGTGNISYDPANHQHMTDTRARKVENAQALIPDLEVFGPETGDVLVLGWGGTFGACREAVQIARTEGLSVAHAQLRHLNPFPKNMRDILGNYRHVLVPELNSGQLSAVIRARLEVPARSLSKVQGRPFTVHEILTRIRELCAGETTA
ncbi:MAG: 2-oxoacid:acceptor oxidoreductase subunit alpha [Paracoccaceae bacterium]|nr:2-oxoacid:acceptor oxidoreductase subunit alpha [Paracoccaceae bacterium]